MLSVQLKATDNLIIPPHVKTQKQLGKYQVKRYIKSFPKIALQCTRFFLRGSSYHRLLRQQGPVAFQNTFKLNYHKRFPRTENHFPFDNGDVGDVCERDFGYCHGFSAALTYWNRLSHFDPGNINQASYPRNVGSDEWFEYYKLIIDKIMNNKEPVIIPGYNHLYEFASSHPRITNYLKEHIALEWAERNINLSSYFKVLRQVYHKFTIKEAKDLHKKLHFKINELNHNPVVWIASAADEKKRINPLEIPGGIHDMQAYRVDPIDKNGDFKVYFWDIYSPNDADEATSIFTISTIKKGSKNKNKPRIFKEIVDSTGKVLEKKSEFDGVFDFADMDTVPFDEIELGEQVVKLMKFYQDNPVFTKHLEENFEKNLKNPAPKFRIPYKGDEPLPQVKLSDGTIWEFPKEMQYYDGNIWIEKHQISKLPNEVIKILDNFSEVKWRNGEKIDRYNLQLPRPYQYLDENDAPKEFKFNLNWFNYEGKFLPNENFFIEAPKDLIKKLKKYTLTWPPTKALNLKYFQDDSYVRNFFKPNDESEELLWEIPIEFITENGLFHVPTIYKSKVPRKVVEVLEKNDLWPLEVPINLSYMTKESRTVKIGNTKMTLPLRWYSSHRNNLIKIPAHELKDYPKILSDFFYGFGPRKNHDFFEVSPRLINQSKIRYNNEVYLFPKDWFSKADDDFFSDSGISIPEDQLEFVPENYREMIVGKGGKWPPIQNRFNSYMQTFYLKDGSEFQFPLSWVLPSDQLAIPRGQENILPQKIIDELFKKGPYKWPLKENIDLYNLQLDRLKLSDGSYFLWPREWMKIQDHNMKIKLPKSIRKIESMIPKEVQDIIKKSYDGKYPENRMVEPWRIGFDLEDLEIIDSAELPDGFRIVDEIDLPDTPDDFFD